MGFRPAILTIFPGVLSISTEPPSPPSFSWPQLCALGCGQGSLALHSSGPVSPSQGLERGKVCGEGGGWTLGFCRTKRSCGTRPALPRNLSAFLPLHWHGVGRGSRWFLQGDSRLVRAPLLFRTRFPQPPSILQAEGSGPNSLLGPLALKPGEGESGCGF